MPGMLFEPALCMRARVGAAALTPLPLPPPPMQAEKRKKQSEAAAKARAAAEEAARRLEELQAQGAIAPPLDGGDTAMHDAAEVG